MRATNYAPTPSTQTDPSPTQTFPHAAIADPNMTSRSNHIRANNVTSNPQLHANTPFSRFFTMPTRRQLASNDPPVLSGSIPPVMGYPEPFNITIDPRPPRTRASLMQAFPRIPSSGPNSQSPPPCLYYPIRHSPSVHAVPRRGKHRIDSAVLLGTTHSPTTQLTPSLASKVTIPHVSIRRTHTTDKLLRPRRAGVGQ